MVRVITLAGDPDTEVALADLLLAETDFDVFMRCLDRSEVLAALKAGNLDALIVVGAPVWLDRECLAEARDRAVALVGIPRDPLEAESLIQAGLTGEELADAPTVEAVRSILARDVTIPPLPPAVGARRVGRTIAVWGAKGSPGRSRIAAELAGRLSLNDPDTLLIDGDPYGGDLRQMLGVVGEVPTVVWAAQRASTNGVSQDIWERLRRVGGSGPVLLPGLPRAELWAEVSDFGWRQLLDGAAMCFNKVLIDVGFCLEEESAGIPGFGSGRNRMATAAVASADKILAVAKGDPIGLRNFMWAFDRDRESLDVERCLIVVNQVRSGHERDIADLFKRHLGRSVAVFVPYAPNEIARAVTDGRCVAELRPGSRFARSIDDLAAALGGSVPRRGLMARLAGHR